jgi:hypothetical protein
MPNFARDHLALTDEQREELDTLQATIDSRVNAILGDDQRRQWKDIQEGRSFGGGIPRPGQIMSPLLQARLKLTSDQKEQMNGLQTDGEATLGALLTEQQAKQLTEMASEFPGGLAQAGRDGGGGPPGAASPPRPRRGPGGMPTGPGGVGEPGSGGPVFRATRYALDYPGLAGRSLAPGQTVEEVFAAKEKEKEKDAQ